MRSKAFAALRTGSAVCAACLCLTATAQAFTSLPEKEKQVYHFDVVVVGAGAAGLTAALSASEQGARVLVVEKMPTVGGNSVQSAGYMLAKKRSTADADEGDAYEAQILHEGKGGNDKALVRQLVDDSTGAIEWLQSKGADLAPNGLAAASPYQFQAGNSVMVGEEVVKTLLQGIESRRIPVQTLTRVSSLRIGPDGRVAGVNVVTSKGVHYEVEAPSVVIATGGFAANEKMTGISPTGDFGLTTTNLPGTLGDGISLTLPLKAKVVDMHDVKVHATTMPYSNLVITIQARQEGAVLIDATGRRFTNELSHKAWHDILSKSAGHAWLVLDQGIIDKLPVLQNYARYGYFVKAQTDEELARYMHCSPEVFTLTMNRYRQLAALGHDMDFERPTTVSTLKQYPLYAVHIQPAVHSTPGGLSINTDAAVLDKSGAPIPGMFAAGEVTGGIFGKDRIEGTGLIDAVVHGRIAGRNAAKWASARTTAPKAPAESLKPANRVAAAGGVAPEGTAPAKEAGVF